MPSGASLKADPQIVPALRIGAGYVAVTVLYFLVRWWVLPHSYLVPAKHGWREVLYSGPSVLLFWLKKLTFPVGLSGFLVLHSSLAYTQNARRIKSGLIRTSARSRKSCPASAHH